VIVGMPWAAACSAETVIKMKKSVIRRSLRKPPTPLAYAFEGLDCK
jgi:hypothetical protein